MGPTAPSAVRWRRPTSRSRSRPWPIRCGDRFEVARVTAGCSGSAASTSIRSGSIPDFSIAIRTRLCSRSWSRRRPCGWIYRTAAGPTSFSSAWISLKGPRVLNISVDLGVHGRDSARARPSSARLRVITEPILRLTSIDLNACKDVDSLEELFNFGNDYLGLIKAAVVASGLVPPSLEGTARPACRPCWGGSSGRARAGDREQGQRHPQGFAPGGLDEPAGFADHALDAGDRPGAQPDRPARPRRSEGRGGAGDPGRMAGRLGRRLAGLGRHLSRHQADRGGRAAEADPEWGVSRGRLLPDASPAEPTSTGRRASRQESAVPASFPTRLPKSLVLVHGGMAQNVGPILNMVTAKYLLARPR